MKNEELNLVELLKDCPKGIKLYSPVCGAVKLVKVVINNDFPILAIDSDDTEHFFTEKGCYIDSGFAECVLFPSKEQRDWNVWKTEQKEKHQYRVGDYIIFKGNDDLIPVVYKILDIDNESYKIDAINDHKEYMQRLSLFDPILENSIKVNQFNPKWLEPFDKVLCRHSDKDKWNAHFFSHINTGDREYPFYATFSYRHCIPYNSETKHLVGTTEKAPEFYINWEE